jgi:hypothetical protein
MKRFLVDTIATIGFFTVVVASVEFLIVGLEPKQVLITRLFMVPVMVATGRPYGLWRDWVFARVRPRRRIGKAFVDVGAFISFQLPVYLASLAFVGATVDEILIAAGTATLGMSILSRPFGVFLELVRKRASVSIAKRKC